MTINVSSKKCAVSVIVLNWNGKRFLDACLGSLLRQNCLSYEILLVDNGSSDGSVEYVRDRFGKDPRLRIITLGKNFGFSKGNNIGTRHANGKYVIILNNDTIVNENFVTALVTVAESDAKIASVGCKILTMDGDIWFSQKFTNCGFIVPIFLQSLVSARIDDISDRRSTNLANSGCACLFNKEVLCNIGGYDEDFLADWEDWDLGYRINLAGYKSVYTSLPLVFHLGGGSFGYPPERYSRVYRNTLSTYFKNYESVNLVTRFFFLAFFLLPISHIGSVVRQYLISSRKLRRHEMLGHFLSLSKGYWMFLSGLKVYSKKRYFIQKLRRTSDKDIFEETSASSLF
jgi:GT2 family glycosyltransferase